VAYLTNRQLLDKVVAELGGLHPDEWGAGLLREAGGVLVRIRECTCVADIDEALTHITASLLCVDDPYRAQVIRRYIDDLLDKRNELARG